MQWLPSIHNKGKKFNRDSAVVDPDPDSEKKTFRIRVAPHPKWIWSKKLLWKSGKTWQFLIKNAQFKNINSFLSKKIPLKTRQEYKGKIYVKNIGKILWGIRNPKNRIRIRKKTFRIHNTVTQVIERGVCRDWLPIRRREIIIGSPEGPGMIYAWISHV